jgi:hypothetical protein
MGPTRHPPGLASAGGSIQIPAPTGFFGSSAFWGGVAPSMGFLPGFPPVPPSTRMEPLLGERRSGTGPTRDPLLFPGAPLFIRCRVFFISFRLWL